MMRTLGVSMVKIFAGFIGLDLGGLVMGPGCQRAHGSRAPKVQLVGQGDAAFRDRRAGEAVAFGNRAHRTAVERHPRHQRQAFQREPRVVFANEFANDPP